MTALDHVPTDSGPEAASSASSRGTRVIGVAALAGVVLLGVFAFAVSPADDQLGESVRIMYLHVPSVAWAYLCMLLCAAMSAVYLVKRNRFADVLAHAAGEIGVLLLFVTLVSGALWGSISWGTYWEWDARLTTTLLLFLMFIGYLALRSVPADPDARATRSAVVGIVSALMIPVVHKSVEWWASLHQAATTFGTLDDNIEGTQQFTVWLSFAVGSLVTAWLLMHRFRVGWMTEAAMRVDLDAAVAQRRAEARESSAVGGDS